MRDLNLCTWEELASMDAAELTYILPISSLEQHGLHLPLGTDDFILQCTLKELSAKQEIPDTMLCLPIVHYGNSHEHLDFPGVVSLGCSSIVSILRDILGCMQRHGVKRLVVLNSHGGNTALLEAYAQEWEVEFGVKVYTISIWSPYFFRDARLPIETPFSQDVHAGELETSVLLYGMENVVRAEQISSKWDNPVELKDYYAGWSSAELSPNNGVLGVPSKASAEKGEVLLRYIGDKICKYLLDIQSQL